MEIETTKSDKILSFKGLSSQASPRLQPRGSGTNFHEQFVGGTRPGADAELVWLRNDLDPRRVGVEGRDFLMEPRDQFEALRRQALRLASHQERTRFLDDACARDAPLRRRLEEALDTRTIQSAAPVDESGRTMAFDPSDNSGLSEGDSQQTIAATGVGPVDKPDRTLAGEISDQETGTVRLDSVQRSRGDSPADPTVHAAAGTETSQPMSRGQVGLEGRYRLEREIGRGGMGVVLKARDENLGRVLAIKVLHESQVFKPGVVNRFIEEAQIGGQLQHHGIAPVHELGVFDDGRPFFSMKLVQGETLAELLQRRTNPDEDQGRFLGIFL